MHDQKSKKNGVSGGHPEVGGRVFIWQETQSPTAGLADFAGKSIGAGGLAQLAVRTTAWLACTLNPNAAGTIPPKKCPYCGALNAGCYYD